MRNRDGAALALGILAAATVSVAPRPAGAQAPMVDYEAIKGAPVSKAANWRLAFRPSVGVLAQSVAQLRAAPGLPAAAIAEADRLAEEAKTVPEAEARRRLWRAAAVLQGKPWGPEEASLGALALRTASPVATGQGDRIEIRALYPAAMPPGARYTLDLYKALPTASATPELGPRVRRLAQGELAGSLPLVAPADLAGAPDGAYLLVAEAGFPDGTSTRLAQSLYVIHDLAARAARIEARLKAVKGHETAKWTAEYPFVLAKGLQAGTREIIAFDFPAAMARSEQIAADLGRGRDDVWQAKGLQERAYAFSPTGELIPYQLFVPSAWTPGRRWPLVVALHGANLDETNMLGRAGGEMQKLAEQYGFVVVAPLGYRLNSGYGSERGMGKDLFGKDPVRRRRSEDDVLQVMARVSAEYRVDPGRRYLTGNSMGGGGTWWIGGQHPGLWAAIAPAAYGGVLPQDVAALETLPILAVVGDHDELGMLGRVQASVKVLQAGGAHPELDVVPGGTHASAFNIAMPRIFQFFAAHRRPAGTAGR